MNQSTMRRFIGGFVTLLAVALSCTTGGRADSGPSAPGLGVAPPAAYIRYGRPIIAIEHVRVIDGTGAAPFEDRTVVIERGTIARIGAASSVVVPAGATRIDGRGDTLTPGFIGTHDHLYYVSGGPMFIMREMPFSFPRLYLAAGVTTIRTTGSVEPETDIRIKDAVDRGLLAGPHIQITTPYLTGYEPQFIQMATLRSPSDARATVNFWADHGATSVKMYMHEPVDIARAIIAAAHARGMRVLAHLCSIGFSQVAAMGVDSIEHGLEVDSEFMPGFHEGVCPTDHAALMRSIASLRIAGPRAQATIRTMIAHHVALSSTLGVFEGSVPPPMRVERRMFALEDPVTVSEVMHVRARILKSPLLPTFRKLFAQELAFDVAFFRAGGLLTQGPDPTGYGATVAGFGDQRDMELLVKGGLTPVQAIQVATLNGARSLGIAQHTGSIHVGKAADLVLVRGNPASNIDAIENVQIVFKDGVGYDSAALLRSIKGDVGRQ